MKKEKIFDPIAFWTISRDFEWLRLMIEVSPVKGELKIYEVLKRLKKFIDEYNLHLKISEEIALRLNRLKARYKGMQKLNKKDRIDLEENISRWADALFEVFTEMDLFQLNTTGILNYRNLIDEGPKCLFKSKNWRRLTKTAKSDLEDSIYCLLSYTPTSACMSALRSVEDVFRLFYRTKTDRGIGSKTFSHCLKDLKKIKGINIDAELIELLDKYIRKYKRNVAMHPGKIFDMWEAERVLINVCDSIEKMYENI